VAKPGLLAIGAVLAAAGGAALGFGLTREPTGGLPAGASEAMASAVAQLDGDVKAARATVKERAANLASLQTVQAAVSTDAATAKDGFERGELKFSPQAGEVIELGQTKQGGKPETLLIQPDGGMHSQHAGTVGSFAELMGDKLVITEVVSVTPKEGADKQTGHVTVSRPLDLKPAIDRLASAGVAGTIDLGGQKRTIGAPAANATVQNVAVPSLPDVKLAVAVPPKTGGKPMALIAGGGIGIALGFVVLVLGLVRKTQAPAPMPTFATATTQMSNPGMVAAGTPSPVDAGSSLVAPTNLGPGALLGRWEIIKRLGSGGMADVYLARSRGEAGFEKTVAVKVMHPHLARMPRAVDHFLDEAKLAARIHHPNVVAILDLGKIGNDYVIVMEYVDGVDLERLLASARAAQRPVPVDIGLGILCRICDGLNAAHKTIGADGQPMNLVHRDVKAANVLVSRQGGVKVVDFGIAKAAQQSHNTIAGETKGTPSMMAPEQRIGEVVDVRADVYSVAAVGYEILTGHGVNLDLAALAHLGTDNWPHLPPPSSLRPQLPFELDNLLLRAMSYTRDNRPADCAVFEATCEQIMKMHGLTASDKDIARWVSSELALLPSGTPEETAQTAGPLT